MNDVIPLIEKFKYVTTINSIMGYYSILLDIKAKERYIIYLIFRIYTHNVLPIISLIVSVYVFQEAIEKLIVDLKNIMCMYEWHH